MDISQIQSIWKQHEAKLEETRKLNLAVLKAIKLDKAKSSLRGLLFLPISTLAFFSITASYALYFTLVNGTSWYFAFSGIVVALASIAYTVLSIKQLRQILSVDYDAPILQLQKDLSRLKSSIVTNLKIAVWVLPFAPFIGIFVSKALFDFDLTAIMGFGMITTLGIITIVLEGFALFALRALKSNELNNRWINWLLQGSGSQVDEALGFLSQIETFAKEEADA